MIFMNLLDAAIDLALISHHGQTNHHDGEPYILHVLRVARSVRDAGLDERHQAVAWLHDAVEDTNLTIDQLHSFFPDDPDVVAAVAALTKKSGQSNEEYYDNLTKFPMAARVKLRDIEDNFRRNHMIQDDAKKLRMAAKYSLGMDKLKDFR